MRMDNELLEFNRKIKEDLILEIHDYIKRYPDEEDPQKVLEFLQMENNIFGRDSQMGHITCSAWILNHSREQTVLIRHRRLDRWIQPGGHIEPFESPAEAALREAVEESGIPDLKRLDSKLLHISVFDFPEGKDGAAHRHFDLRYLMQAPVDARLVAPEEVGAAKWVSVNRLDEYTHEQSLLVMADKTAHWLNRGESARREGSL